MAMQDSTERSDGGRQLQSRLRGIPAPEPASLYQASWRDFIYAEVWSRPVLDHRSRFLIAMAGAACEGASPAIIDGYVRGALVSGELSLLEVREAALHLAVYAGWGRGDNLDQAISRVAAERDLPPADNPSLCAGPRDPEQRLAEGAKNFTDTMLFQSPPPVTPYFEGGILNFVFGEMWTRPGLDQRSRRWVTMVGVADSASAVPIRSHTYAAMASGNASFEEMQEFVLQYAIHGGWPKASVMQGVVLEMGKRVAEGLPFE